jgi:glycosyltransferase involved in cell wall biosynthesis
MQRRGSFNINLLSVVIPAYKQQETIVRDIKNISKTLEKLGYKYEILIVVDGIVDKTFDKAQKLSSTKIKIYSYKENNGKGYAVKYGMLKAKGNIIGFLDAGMDINPSGLRMLLGHMEWYNADIIVGSKMHPVSQVNYPFYRKILTWGYRLLTATLFGFKVKDTQVGLKFFKKEVVQDVLPRLVVKKFAFDIEILAVAHALGYNRIYEAPVEIKFKNGTINSTNFWKIILWMMLDTLAVFYRLRIIKYYTNPKLNK